jgi:hypothetical protein
MVLSVRGVSTNGMDFDTIIGLITVNPARKLTLLGIAELHILRRKRSARWKSSLARRLKSDGLEFCNRARTFPKLLCLTKRVGGTLFAYYSTLYPV